MKLMRILKGLFFLEQNDRLSFVSLSYQINDVRTAGYSEKEIIAGRYIPFNPLVPGVH